MTEPLRCVLDTSVSIKQFIDHPLTPKVNQLLDYLVHPQTEMFATDTIVNDFSPETGFLLLF